jgi:hypothetical protein
MATNKSYQSVAIMRASFTSYLLLTWLASAAYAQRPTIDGVFSEWTPALIVAEDAKGDANGSFDLSSVSVTTNGTELYLNFDIGSKLNLQNGDESDGKLVLVIDVPNGQQLNIDFRGRTATLRSSPDEHLPWSQIAFICLPTFASDQYELRLNLAALGAQSGDKIALNFTGSDSLEQAASITLSPAEQWPTIVNSRGPRDVRIASLNTRWQGLSDPYRVACFQRLLAASDADVFCFQEEFDKDKFYAAVPRVVPRRKCEQVNLQWWPGGCGIATTLPLELVEFGLDRRTAAAVRLAPTRYIVIVSTHLKCCGYIGSDADQARIDQAYELVDRIQRLRKGYYGHRIKDAAVVILGDYNLVGSRRPLDIIKTAGLTDWVLPRVGDGHAITWRGITTEELSFWPGRLDLLSYDPARLQPETGCVIDTSLMSQPALRRLGLCRDDSWASDHLMLVADFQLIHGVR